MVVETDLPPWAFSGSSRVAVAAAERPSIFLGGTRHV